MAQYDNAIALAERLIKKFGQIAYIREYGDPVAGFDADAPWHPPRPISRNIAVNAVFLTEGENRTEIEEVSTQDDTVYLVGATPRLRDRLYRTLVGGDDGYAIVKVETLNPNGQIIFHKLMVRS